MRETINQLKIGSDNKQSKRAKEENRKKQHHGIRINHKNPISEKNINKTSFHLKKKKVGQKINIKRFFQN